MLAPRATTALVALLRSLGLPPGSEVLMPASLCASPAYAVRWSGLRPLFADVSLADFNMDLASAEKMVGPQTRMLLAVPLFGHAFDAEAVVRFAESHNLILVEDAAQATGIRYATGSAGSIGVCSLYSFGPGKIADAGGGAAMLADDPSILRRAAAQLASMPSGGHVPEATAARIGEALAQLPGELAERAEISDRYREALAIPGITHPHVPRGPLLKYSVLLPTRAARDKATNALLRAGIEATNLYPPLPLFFPEARHSNIANFPNALNIAHRIINLPTHNNPPEAPRLAAGALRLALQERGET